VIRIQKWWRKMSNQPRCDGCYFNALNQLAHMRIGGCLYEPE
jgi:hypothetical protein